MSSERDAVATVRERRPSFRQFQKRQKALGRLGASCYSLLKARERGASAEYIDECEYMIRYDETGCTYVGVSQEMVEDTKGFILEVLPGLPAELREAAIRAKRLEV